jgi:hypothetical protein
MKELLIKARDYLADPDHWCQHHLHINPKTGNVVGTAYAKRILKQGGEPMCCALGALYLFAPAPDADGASSSVIGDAEEALLECTPSNSIIDVNDDGGYEKVMKMYGCAIDRESA